MYIVNCYGDILSYDLGEPIHLSYLGYYSLDLNHTSTTFDPSLDFDSFQSAAAFELAIDSSPPSTSPIESLSSAPNKLYLIFLSSITNKLFLVQFEQLLSKFTSNTIKYKLDNIFTKQRMLAPALIKNFANYDYKQISNAIRNLLYNKININDPADADNIDFDESNCNQIR